MGLFSRRKSKSDRSGASNHGAGQQAGRGMFYSPDPSGAGPAQVPSQPPPAYGSTAFNQGYSGGQAAGAAASYYDQHPQNQQQQYLNPGGSAPMPNSIPNRASFPLPTANPTVALEDDPYSFLSAFDTVLLIDDSGSMAGGRWRQTAEALSSIVGITTYYDRDGIDIYFLNHSPHPSHRGIKSADQVMNIFSTISPRGATPTGQRLNSILKPYLEKLKKGQNVKPLNIICITDGSPTDDLESVIVQTAKKLDNMEADLTQVGIQFFQVGDDRSATEALKDLDDALYHSHGVRDMVDTVPWKGHLQGDQMLKVVLGAVNRRLDRRRA